MSQYQQYFCPRCNAPIEVGQRFCGNCSLPLDPASLNAFYAYQQQQMTAWQQAQPAAPPVAPPTAPQTEQANVLGTFIGRCIIYPLIALGIAWLFNSLFGGVVW